MVLPFLAPERPIALNRSRRTHLIFLLSVYCSQILYLFFQTENTLKMRFPSVRRWLLKVD